MTLSPPDPYLSEPEPIDSQPMTLEQERDLALVAGRCPAHPDEWIAGRQAHRRLLARWEANPVPPAPDDHD